MGLPLYEAEIRAALRHDPPHQTIFDPLRKRHVRFTPEEWVRQRLIYHLLLTKLFPAPLIAIERSIKVFNRTRRFDLLAYGRSGSPLLIAECKAPSQPLHYRAWLQLGIYNSTVAAPFRLLTNGELLWFGAASSAATMSDLPTFDILIEGAP